MALTDAACKNAKCPPDKPRKRYTDAGGMYLEVQPNGAKHWRWKYRFGGKEKRLALGTYPAVSLKDARAEREKARETLARGTDPVQARQEAKHALQVRIENTFEAVALAWWERWRKQPNTKTGALKTQRHADYVKRRLEADVFPHIGNVPVADLTARRMKDVVKRIEERDALDIAKRCWQTCGQIFEYAVTEDLIERSPTMELRPGAFLIGRQKINYARVDGKELPQLLRRMETYTGSPYTRLAMKLMALTFVRTGELIGARWEEFDLDAAEWRIPPERMKMRTPHIVPMSTQAVEVVKMLTELRNLSPMVFPGERDHEKPMSNNTILKALERMGYKGTMTGHGFRGVASTILHELGWRHDVIELQLAHQERNAVSAAYNHATYLAERRKMMQAWADHLDQMRAGAKVLPFKAA